jgi:hypothetical protein
MTLYVYFKFIVSDHPMTLKRIRGMQEQLMQEYSDLECDLLKRPNPDEDGRETWMEIYRGVTSQSSLFMGRLSELALKNDLPQPRRNEVFISVE